MKKYTIIKIFSLILLFTFITSINYIRACPDIQPQFAHLSLVNITDDPNILVFNATKITNVGQVKLDIETGEFSQSTKGENMVTDALTASNYQFKINLNLSTNDTIAYIEFDSALYNVSLKLKDSYKFTEDPLFFGFVSASQELAYIIFSYDVDSESMIGADLRSMFTIPLNNLTGITHGYTALNPYYLQIAVSGFTLYDDNQVIFLPGQGVDCTGGVYYHFENGYFELISNINYNDFNSYDTSEDRLIIINLNFENFISTVLIYSNNSSTPTSFTINEDTITEILSLSDHSGSSDIIELPILLSSIFIGIGIITIIRRSS